MLQSVKSWRFSFSLLLPILELTLWLVLVPTQAILFYTRLRYMAHGAAYISLQMGEFGLELPSRRLFPFVFESVAMRESEIISSINLPGAFVDALVTLPLGGPYHWHPLVWTWE